MSALVMTQCLFKASSFRVLLASLCGLAASRNSDAIVESHPGGAIAHGTATLDDTPLVGWIVSVEGRTLTCERPALASGRSIVNATGRYDVGVTGQMYEGSYCVRAGLARPEGSDTVHAFETVEFRPECHWVARVSIFY